MSGHAILQPVVVRRSVSKMTINSIVSRLIGSVGALVADHTYLGCCILPHSGHG